MSEYLIIGVVLSVIVLVFGISALILWKADGDISLKGIFNGSRDFIDWHFPWAVATWPKIEEHFALDKTEVDMLDSCIDYKLLKQYVVFTEGGQTAYIVFKVSEVRRLINLRRKNMGARGT